MARLRRGPPPRAAQSRPGDPARAASAAAAEPRTWLVGARGGRRAAAIARAHGARRVIGGAYVVARGRARALAAALRARGLLEYAEPDIAGAPAQAPADPLSVVPQAGWRDLVVGGAVAPPVTPESPLIALVDSQADAGHPEIGGSNTTSAGGQAVGDFHGTATATVAAAPQNGVGFVGVWPNARALNLPLPPEITCSASARRIARAVDLGAAVINMSYGFGDACRTEYLAIQRAVARGVVPVAAAGNEFRDGNPVEFPAGFPHVLTVAAVGADERPAFFSNQNAAMDLSAPGEQVLAGVPVAFDPDGRPDGFAALDGTSFAAPMVSAAVAWVRAARPDLAPDQVAQVVRRGARDVGRPGWEAATGFGVLDVAGALARRAPARDPLEPNDDVELVDGRVLGRRARTVFRGAPAGLRGRVDRYEDPADVYRIRIPARATVRVRIRPAFGDPDLYVFSTAAATVVRSRGLIASSRRSGRRTDSVLHRQPRRPGPDALRRRRPRPAGALARRGLRAGDQARLVAGAHCASARLPVPSSAGGVGTCGLSRRYHSASRAAMQPDAGRRHGLPVRVVDEVAGGEHAGQRRPRRAALRDHVAVLVRLHHAAARSPTWARGRSPRRRPTSAARASRPSRRGAAGPTPSIPPSPGRNSSTTYGVRSSMFSVSRARSSMMLRGAELVAAVHHGHLRGELGEEDRLLHRRVAAAHDDRLAVLEEGGVAGRAVGHAAAVAELLLARHPELLVLGAHGEHDGARLEHVVADAARCASSPSDSAGSKRVALSVMKRAPNRSAWSRMVCISSGPMIPSRKPG